MTDPKRRWWTRARGRSLVSLCCALGWVAASQGCVGEIGGGEGEKPTTVSGSLLCDPNVDPSATPLVRLSQRQYQSSLRDLFGQAIDDATVSVQLGQFPADGEVEDSFSHMDGRLSQRHVDTYYGVADALAALVSNDRALRGALGVPCAGDAAPDAACVESFVRTFGRRVFRRPLADDEVTRLLELDAGDVDETFRSLLFVLLMSPQFNYHFEIDGAPDGRDDRLRLGDYEVASKLSFHFWQSMPDDELLDAAERGELTTEAGFEAQVERLFNHERTRATVRRFYAEWFRLEGFAGFARTPAFEAFADDIAADEALFEAMRAEVEALTDHYTWETEGSYADMLASDLVFTESSALASLYGVEPWDGGATHPTFPGDRAGLLTRAALLVSSNERTNPFKRGAYIRKEILCDPLAQPDPNQLPADALSEPPLDPERSTRDRFAAKTAAPECQACHAQFNPIGFVLEAYDGLGRFRTVEDIFDENGEVLASVPVDATADVRVADERLEVAGPLALMDEITASGKAETCFARHYFRFTYRRHEQDASDGCSMVAVREALTRGGGLADALKVIALEPSFRLRVIADLEETP